MKKLIQITMLLFVIPVFGFAQYSVQNMTTNHLISNNKDGIRSGSINVRSYRHYIDSTEYIRNGDYYMTKSRNQKVAGYCFMGAGVVVLAIGLASFPQNTDLIFGSEKDKSKADRASNTIIIGALILCGSTPFFILSKINKKKANLLLKYENAGPGIPIQTSAVAGITAAINIGRK